jgi:hypothetical protein
VFLARPRVTKYALARAAEALAAMHEGRLHGRAVLVVG